LAIFGGVEVEGFNDVGGGFALEGRDGVVGGWVSRWGAWRRRDSRAAVISVLGDGTWRMWISLIAIIAQSFSICLHNLSVLVYYPESFSITALLEYVIQKISA
jgi:hypothetical protein